jgi:hypothetical protein
MNGLHVSDASAAFGAGRTFSFRDKEENVDNRAYQAAKED